jgi:3-hydroxybutyryl-CoA dehydrogenase
MEAALGRLSTTQNLEEAVAKADLVIEAIIEDMAVKLDLFGSLDRLTPPATLLASNTSALSITEMAGATGRPDRVLGMHFFNPPHIMKLIEIIQGPETSAETVQTAKDVSRKMGKETVLVNESPGFITSRVNALVGNEAFRMLQEGVASAEDIDKAIRLGLNYPMGPLEMVDLVGLDTRLHILEHLHATLGERYRPCPIHVKYVRAGRLGRKTGKGIYEYDKDGGRK